MRMAALHPPMLHVVALLASYPHATLAMDAVAVRQQREDYLIYSRLLLPIPDGFDRTLPPIEI